PSQRTRSKYAGHIPTSLALLRFQCLEPNLVQHFGLARDFVFARWELVRTQYVSQNVSILLSAQAARVVLRHRRTHAFEQLAKRHAVPIRTEPAADKARRHFLTSQVASMA